MAWLDLKLKALENWFDSLIATPHWLSVYAISPIQDSQYLELLRAVTRPPTRHRNFQDHDILHLNKTEQNTFAIQMSILFWLCTSPLARNWHLPRPTNGFWIWSMRQRWQSQMFILKEPADCIRTLLAFAFGICMLSEVKGRQPAHSLVSLWSNIILRQHRLFCSFELIEMFVILAKIHDQQSASSSIPKSVLPSAPLRV